MGKRTITYIILFSALSLAGLIFIQMKWIRDALDLAEKQYAHRVDLALRDVLEELKEQGATKPFGSRERREPASAAKNIIDTDLLSVLIEKYINYHKLNPRYAWSVVKSSNDSTLISFPAAFTGKNRTDVHRACLPGTSGKDALHLEIFFPGHQNDELSQTGLWIVTSSVFLLIIIFSFYYTIHAIIRQKKISEIRDDFINNITHEFKTPLATISLASEVLLNTQKEDPDSRIARYARVIYDENSRMRRQIERVLQLAALEKKDDFNLDISRINMDEEIRKIMDNLLLEHCDREIDLQYRLNAGNPFAAADALHLGNIINNLVSNAIKYSDEKTVIIISSRNENGYYIFSVEDRGKGISRDNLPHIFDRFYRVPAGDVQNARGFGIGLYYVKKIIKAHGGKINVTSKPGKGTRFDVYFPLRAGE